MTLGQMQESVQLAAQNRFIAAMEEEAKEGVRNKHYWEKGVKEGLEAERNDITRKRQLELQNAMSIRQQIQDNKLRFIGRRKEYIAAASAHEFPLFTETFISADEVEEYRKKVKENWRDELCHQRNVHATLNNVIERKDKQLAEQVLQANMRKMNEDQRVERARRLEIGNHLKNSWDREIKLGELRKAILAGEDVAKDIVALPSVKPLDPSCIRRAK